LKNSEWKFKVVKEKNALRIQIHCSLWIEFEWNWAREDREFGADLAVRVRDFWLWTKFLQSCEIGDSSKDLKRIYIVKF